MIGAQILLEALIEQGVDTVFGYPGGMVIDIYDQLYFYQNKIRHILCADEQGAVHAADGYARATGKPGVVIATSGPGATNLVTGIAAASLDSVPLVAITGNVPSSLIGKDAFQEVDITGITMPITKHNYFVNRVDKLADIVRNAFITAISGRPGAVLIDIPRDIQIADCDYSLADPVKSVIQSVADESLLKNAADIINKSKKPCIFIGGGVISSGAEAEVLSLADKIDAPVTCSLMGLTALSTDNPRFLGMLGMHGLYAATMAVQDCDCLIALGTRFSDRTTGNKTKFAPAAKKVQIEIDTAEIDKNVPVDCSLHGDVRETLQALNRFIRKHKHTSWINEINSFRSEQNRQQSLTAVYFGPKTIMDVVNQLRPENSLVATDVGQHQMWAAQWLKFTKPRSFISNGGLGAMGFGMGSSIGASVATDKRVFLITGDGSFGMNLTELATAVSYKLPITIILLDNRALGMVRQWQAFSYNKRYSCTELDRKTDFVSLAKAFGADGVICNDINSLSTAIKRSLDVSEPYLIVCNIDPDEIVLPMVPSGGSADDIITEEMK